ncbi:cytochrome c-type biogenesis protein CcdA [Streptococcus sanguinis SK1058]|nr:cytochrome c-type biogenesis protein CcdA [Streptococcus sanguinis SK1058]
MESPLFFVSVFLAGILSFFSPCIFPLLPVYIGILLDDKEVKTLKVFGRELAWQGMVKTLFFIAGISTVFFLLGFGAGFLGTIIYSSTFRYVMGGLIILLGLHQMELINIRQLQIQKSLTFKRTARNIIFGLLSYWGLPLALVGLPALDRFSAQSWL